MIIRKIEMKRLLIYCKCLRHILINMENPSLSALKKSSLRPHPKYGNLYDIIRKKQQQQQQSRQNNNNTNIKISSQEELSTMETTPTTPATPATPTTLLLTEDTGKILEKAICDVYGIPYKGPFIYSQAAVDQLVPRVSKLKTDNLFPQCNHTGEKGARYDFTSEDGTQHLSAKSNKISSNNVAPQVIGQPSYTKFCQLLGLDEATIDTLVSSPQQLKKYIQENIATILPIMWEHTFDCPIIYYRERGNQIQFIKETNPTPIDWSSYTYTWTRPHDKWNNSTTLKILRPATESKEKPVSIAEFQFHTTSRKNLANRWNLPAILKLFQTRFTIVEL